MSRYCILWNGDCPYGDSTGEFENSNLCTMPCFEEFYKEEN